VRIRSPGIHFGPCPGSSIGIRSRHPPGRRNHCGRWTEAKKKAILDSRVQGTRHLAEALAEASSRPRIFICASAIGYYGNRGDELLTEDSPPSHGFLPDVTRAWEAATQIAFDAGIRTVNLRFGLVLSPKGGALTKMLTCPCSAWAQAATVQVSIFVRAPPFGLKTSPKRRFTVRIPASKAIWWRLPKRG